MVFYVNLHVSTVHGSENLCIFLTEMPDKFEREKIDVNFQRVNIEGMEMLAARVRSLRP